MEEGGLRTTPANTLLSPAFLAKFGLAPAGRAAVGGQNGGQNDGQIFARVVIEQAAGAGEGRHAAAVNGQISAAVDGQISTAVDGQICAAVDGQIDGHLDGQMSAAITVVIPADALSSMLL
ncbi:hypothetical protein T484DRAFT_1821202 [Baffinella frigidus]|nr:hypothetical protein T484DRAFT_1821202 [Cryptophyta sp. CCMP2293]